MNQQMLGYKHGIAIVHAKRGFISKSRPMMVPRPITTRYSNLWDDVTELTMLLAGPTLCRRRLLTARGWGVIGVPYFEWAALQGSAACLSYLEALCLRAGTNLVHPPTME